jgi:hypothetical protein
VKTTAPNIHRADGFAGLYAPAVVDIFAGCGGWSIGAEQAFADADYSSAFTQSTVYEAFGQTVSQSGGSTNNRLRNTKERDEAIGQANDGLSFASKEEPTATVSLNDARLVGLRLCRTRTPLSGIAPSRLSQGRRGHRAPTGFSRRAVRRRPLAAERVAGVPRS